MQDNEKKLCQLKSIIRALLVSQGKTETSVRRLAFLYKEENGCPLRHWEYGSYPSLEDLLKSIPDTCYLKYNRNAELCVHPVSNEKTAHVSSLVAKQKPKKASKSCTYKGRNHYYRQQHQHQHLSMYPRPPPQPVTPSLVLQVLLELRNNSSPHSRTRGLRKVDVLARVKSRVGSLASNYYINNLNFHLQSLSNDIAVKNDSIYFREDLLKQSSLPSLMSNFIPDQVVKRALTKEPVVDKPNYSVQSDRPPDLTTSIHKSTTPTHNDRLAMARNCVPVDTAPVSTPTPSDRLALARNSVPVDKPPVSTVDAHTACGGNDNSTGVARKEDIVEPLQKASSRESQHIHEVPSKDDKSMNGISNAELKINGSHELSDLIKQRTKIRLEKLIENRPEGIWCSDLPSVYQKEYAIDLEYNELGFHSIVEFVAALPEIFTIVEPGDCKKQMVISAKNNGLRPNSKRKTLASHYNFEVNDNEVEPIPLNLPMKVANELIPEGYMTINEEVEQIQVSSICPEFTENYIEVMVSEIFTPSFFWIHLRKYKKELKKLMNHLKIFFEDKDLTDYKIPQVILKPGLNVACLYGGQWHRAMVKKVKHDGYIVLFFYDYGTVKTYDPNELYYLHKSFSNLPAQAIACALHHVKPIGSTEWPKSCTDAFINKVWEVPMLAEIASKDENSNTMYISLTDTRDENVDVHINDWMVESKLAEWGKMVNKIPLHRLCYYDEVELIKIRDEEQISYEETILRQTTLIPVEKDKLSSPNDNENSSNAGSFRDRSEMAKEKIAEGAYEVYTEDAEELIVVRIPKINGRNEGSSSGSTSDKQASIDELTRQSSMLSLDSQNVNENKQIKQLVSNGSAEISQAEVLTNGYSNEKSPTPSTHSSKANFTCRSVDGNIINGNPMRQTTTSEITKLDDGNANLVRSNGVESKQLPKDESYCNGKSLSAHSQSNSIENSLSLSSTYFTTHLSKRLNRKLMHIFHYQNEGYLYINEFVDAFTHFKDPRVFEKLLSMLKYPLTLMHISRDMEPQLFSELNKSQIDVPREKDQIKSDFTLRLMPLRETLKILGFLNIIPSTVVSESIPVMKKFRQDAEFALYTRYNNEILYDILNVIFQYKDYKRAMKQ